MSAQATRRGVPAVALWGGLGALAWAAITVLTGGSSAHADEGDPSLLGGAGSLVSQTVSTVSDTVTAVAKPIVTEVATPVVAEVVKPVVTEVVAPVVTEVVAPVVAQASAPVQQAAPVVETVSETVAQVPVAGQPAAPVVEAVTETVVDTATDTVESVTTPVNSLLEDSPASQILRPVTDAAASLPVLGALLGQLGVFTLVEELASVVDETTGIVGGVVDDVVESTVPPIVETLEPLGPPARGEAEATVSSASVPHQDTALLAPATAAATPTSRASVAAPALVPVDISAAPVWSAPAAGQDGAPVPAPLGSPVAPSSSTGSGGASALSHARLGDVVSPVLSAVERTPGAPDDVLPTSLVADTDVSPD